MSYEGYTEYLCETGHKYRVELFSSNDTCPICKKGPKYEAEVDETNGYDKTDPSTFPAPTVEVGFTDEWRTDHYGTKYAIKHVTYKPAPKSRWVYCPLSTEIQEA